MSETADSVCGFPTYKPYCLGCKSPLLMENAWMSEGCPCNSKPGCNTINGTRWRLLRDLQQQQSDELAAAMAEVERLKEAANIALGHVVELSDAWMRGVIRESDGNGGLRSNRNADVEYFLRCAIDGKDRQKINVVYSPAWLLSEDRPDA